jgi:hypothetical protein
LNVFALHDDAIFVAAAGEIKKAPRDAFTRFEDAAPVTTTTHPAFALVTDGTRLVWIEARAITARHAELWTSGIDGSSPTLLASEFSVMPLSAEETVPLAIDATYAYYAGVVGKNVFQPDSTTLYRVPLAGGPSEALASEKGGYPHIAIGEQSIYWLTLTNLLHVQPFGAPAQPAEIPILGLLLTVRVKDGRICVASRDIAGNANILCRDEVDAGAFTTLAALDTQLINNLDMRGSHVYGADGFSYEIRDVTRKDGHVFATTEGSAAGLALSGDTFYWATIHGVFELRHAVGQ